MLMRTLIQNVVLVTVLSIVQSALAAADSEPYHLIFGIGLHDEGAFTPVGQSDGVTFIIEVRSGDQVKQVFKRHKPKENHTPEYFSMDLTSWRGKQISVRFIADPGSANNAAYDWGVWIEPRIVKGRLPAKWWEKNLTQDPQLAVVFDAVDSCEKAVQGVGTSPSMRSGAQFTPAAVPVGWSSLPYAEKYCGKRKVRGILHEPAWDGEAVASWAEYTVGLGVSVTSMNKTSGIGKEDTKAVKVENAFEQLREAHRLSSKLDSLISEGRNRGLQMRLPRVTAAVLKIFIPRLREDLEGIAWYCGPNFPGWYEGRPPYGYVISKVKMAEKTPKDIYPPEFIAERKERGILLAPYLVWTAGRAIREAEAILKDPVADVKYPEYNMGKLQLKDGYFYDGDQPALLAGLYTNRDVRPDYENLAEMGVCFTQPERLNVFTTLLAEDKTSRAFIDSYVVRDTLEPTRKCNIGCVFDLGLHYLPGWMFEKYPDTENPGADKNHYSPYLVCSKRFREFVSRYLDELIQATSKSAATMGYEMGNQPYLNPWSPAVIHEFQEWVKKEYGTVDAVNAKWSSHFSSFSEIQPDKNFRKIEPLGFRYDWVRFQHGITGEWYRWLRGQLNRRDPGRPVTVQPAGNFFEPQKFAGHDFHRVAIDEVDLYRNITEISGFDACTWYWGRLVYDQMGQHIDLIRSIAPQRPMVNFEYGTSTYNSKTVWNPDYIRASLWYSFLHGLGGCSAWIWTVSEEREETQTNTFARWPDRAESFGRTALELRRHAGQIVQFGRAQAQVAILYPSPARWFADAGLNSYYEQARAIWNAATFMDAPFDFICDEQIAEGRLARYRLLLVPVAPYVQEPTYQKIRDFVRQGGVMVVNGGSFAFDPYARPREMDIPRESFPISHYMEAKTNAKRYGKGFVYGIDAASSREYGLLLRKVYERAGIWRPIRVSLANNTPNWSIEAKTVREKGQANQYLFYCFNLGNTAENILISPRAGYTVLGNDLIADRVFAPRITLKPMEVCMWRFAGAEVSR